MVGQASKPRLNFVYQRNDKKCLVSLLLTGNSVLIYSTPDSVENTIGYREIGNLKMLFEIHTPPA